MTLPTNNGILRPGISDLQFMHPTNLTDPLLMKELYRLFFIFLLFESNEPDGMKTAAINNHLIM